jgi:glycerol-3-phosphate dehydrogenase
MYDIAIIGGGINGCGIARDAAGRGLSVVLVEKGDLASATSSASTKLIHGGLRYLEQLRFRLVAESLKEREVLLRIAPHVVTPLRFVLPHRPDLGSSLLLRLGLFLYDRIGGRGSLPRSGPVDLSSAPAGRVLKPAFRRGLAYSDCRVDDARLVVLNAMDAAARGARVRVRTEAISARRHDGRWHIDLDDAASGRAETVTARALVNASGPWVAELAQRIEPRSVPRVRLVQGSHIVVRKRLDHDTAYILPNVDRRVVFAIPYERDLTLVGTTDVEIPGDPGSAAISKSEIAYLCTAVNEYLAEPITPADIVWAFSGVRALADEGRASPQDASRDLALVVDGSEGEPPLVSAVGGKLTTYRRLAEKVLERLRPALPVMGRSWTAWAPLPGGDFDGRSLADVARELAAGCPGLEPAVAERLAAGYGTMARVICAGARRPDELGIHFGAGLYEREVVHLVRNEWAMTADDILWRRTKLGLHLGEGGRERLSQWLATHARSGVPSSGRLPSGGGRQTPR